MKEKNIVKLEIIAIIQDNIGDAHSIRNLNYSVPEEIPIVFHKGSNYCYYYFIVTGLAEELKKQFACLGEKTKKYIIFTVPIEKSDDDCRVLTYYVIIITTKMTK